MDQAKLKAKLRTELDNVARHKALQVRTLVKYQIDVHGHKDTLSQHHAKACMAARLI